MRRLLLLAFALLSAVAIAGGAGAQSRFIEFPDVDGYQTLVVDLHIHSIFSDGDVWPSIRVQESLLDGLDLMAVTEHLEYQPHRDDIPHPDRNRAFDLAAERAATTPDLMVVNGAEITRSMPPGHANAVFIHDANALLVDDPMEAFRAANEQNGFVFWNHPSWTGQRGNGVAVMTPMHRDLIAAGLLHGIEVANGPIYSAEALQMALDFNLAILGVSDVHGLIDWDYEVGAEGHRTVTLVFATERTPAAAAEALHARRTVAWIDNTLIGREDVLRPLLEASLTVSSVAWRNNSELLEVTLANRSDAVFELANVGGHNLYDRPTLIRVPAHGEITLGIAGESRARFNLEVEVLNALVAPRSHPRMALDVQVPPRPDAAESSH